MTPEAALRPSARLLLSFALLFSSIGFGFSQGGGAFGFSPGRLAEVIAGKDLSPVLSLSDGELDNTGAYGPSAYYYLARWIDSRTMLPAPSAAPPAPGTSATAAARARLLYRMAFDRCGSLVRREAGIALLGSLRAAGLWDELLAFSSDYAKAPGPEWKSERPRLDALDALGRSAEATALVARLSSAYPEGAAKDADAIACFAAAADLRSRGKAWPRAFRRLLLERPSADWSARAYALTQSEPKLRAVFSEDELHALAMRDAVRRKDFGAAYREALLAPVSALSRAATQAMVADAGKAFLYSGMAKEGETRFAALAAAAAKRPAPTGAAAGIGWTALYYRARFARELERWNDSARLFKRAAAEAADKADADSSLWYAADSAYRGALSAAASLPASLERSTAESAARAALLDALAAASAFWQDPGSFSDLVNGLFRDALRARDWRTIDSIDDRLAGKLDPDAAARIAYASARAFELGYIPGQGADPENIAAKSAVRFAAIADDRSAPFYYRALSARRARIEPTLVSPEAYAAEVPPDDEAPGELESLVSGMASFGLADIALSEAKARKEDLSDLALRRLAILFSSLGRPDCAIRMALELTSRPDYLPRKQDYELLYPRPYLDEIRALRLGDRLPERLAYALVRSESLFKADALSWAGAVGLTQLMPSTAEGQAKALGLANYDLLKPKDNLAIGLAHFASLIGRTEGKPLHAMMAYNAGWGRLKAWVAESGDLPGDLLVEALGIEETRHYCRNILQATVMYGLLYYGRNAGDTVGELEKDN
jgi:soluble lytic murein transglycosylase-like protein